MVECRMCGSRADKHGLCWPHYEAELVRLQGRIRVAQEKTERRESDWRERNIQHLFPWIAELDDAVEEYNSLTTGSESLASDEYLHALEERIIRLRVDLRVLGYQNSQRARAQT